MEKTFHSLIESIVHEDTRYHPQSYIFMMEALAHAQRRLKSPRHVSGLELLNSVRLLLIQQFGPMTLTVLDFWGIKSSEDFGNIVFNLVDKGVLSKTEEDDMAHFRDAFDFQKVFENDYRRQLKRRVSRLR
jgi:uncharacterized repeat protein (TIGR04138 family)